MTEIPKLSLDQALFELGVDPEEDDIKAEAAEAKRQRQIKFLEKVASEIGLTVPQLRTASIDQLVSVATKVEGKPVNKLAMLALIESHGIK